jgi:hypothetical protein
MRELADHILDLARNAVEAGASELLVTVALDPEADRLTITLADNGRGMDAETVAQVTDAFYTTRQTRRQGLGLPLFAATCERCGGDLKIESELGHGTTVRGWMQASCLDRPPLGDVGAVVQALALEPKLGHWRYEHRVGGESFVEQSTGETPVPPGPAELVRLRERVNEQVRELTGGN